MISVKNVAIVGTVKRTREICFAIRMYVLDDCKYVYSAWLFINFRHCSFFPALRHT